MQKAGNSMYRPLRRLPPPVLAALLLFILPFYEVNAMDEILIEDDSGLGGEITIDSGEEGPGEIIFDDAIDLDSGMDAPVAETVIPDLGKSDDIGEADDTTFEIDDVRLEYGHQLRDASDAERELYGKLALSFNWRPQPQWEFQVAGRVDGYSQESRADWSQVRTDYGDSFIRYRDDNYRLTAGTQTVVWGRMDEVPLSDRVSTADLSRFVLDRLEDRRRSNPMLRLEANVGEGRLDLAWLYRFRAAELPDQDSIWYPIDTINGRILGIDQADIPAASVQGATIVEDEPDGDGGFGIRYSASPFFGDIGLTVAHTRRSMPYYRLAAPSTFKTEYPRSWTFGADAAVDAMGATWRGEFVYTSDNPVTLRNLGYTTTEGVEWGVAVEMHPWDGNTRLNLQLVGSNLIDPGAILDRTEAYSLNGEIEVPFDRERWRAKLNFLVGLDKKDLYLNPEIAYLAWEPHELYLALHYFDGDEQTLGGFHEDHSSVNLGWRAQF